MPSVTIDKSAGGEYSLKLTLSNLQLQPEWVLQKNLQLLSFRDLLRTSNAKLDALVSELKVMNYTTTTKNQTQNLTDGSQLNWTSP